MAKTKQIQAAKENIQKAQKAWQHMTRRQHSLTKSGGNFFRIVVRPKEEFVTFRLQDVGKKGHIERLAGKRSSGSWDTQAWLISKTDAHIERDILIADSLDAKEVIEHLGSRPIHIKADIFKAKDRPNIPEREKPTGAQKRARSMNIRKAQAAR